jgi:flagellar hook assembly protein FlgD
MPSITWDGKEDSGHDAAGGIYFVRMVTSSGGEATTRITLVR